MTAPGAVEAAARAMACVPGLPAHWGGREFYLLATAALAAAAPLIAQQTLLDAAEQLAADSNDQGDWWDSAEETYTTPTGWLRARAAALTPKDTLLSSHYIYLSCPYPDCSAFESIYTGDVYPNDFPGAGPDSFEGESISTPCNEHVGMDLTAAERVLNPTDTTPTSWLDAW